MIGTVADRVWDPADRATIEVWEYDEILGLTRVNTVYGFGLETRIIEVGERSLLMSGCAIERGGFLLLYFMSRTCSYVSWMDDLTGG